MTIDRSLGQINSPLRDPSPRSLSRCRGPGFRCRIHANAVVGYEFKLSAMTNERKLSIFYVIRVVEPIFADRYHQGPSIRYPDLFCRGDLLKRQYF